MGLLYPPPAFGGEDPAHPPPEETSAPAEASVDVSPSDHVPLLKFQFRFQQWEHVLEWFAEQAGLSLVIDSPPPGSFNFTDTKEYTPTEAIDLLNGVLLLKGYMLIRRGRMLQVIDMQQGIPEALIPRISVEELDEHGKFEFVSVMFPLGKKEVSKVTAEITPLLTQPYGKAVPLPATKQMLVTDTAAKVRAIGELIESIPEPAPPKKQEKKPEPKKPDPPVLVVYDVKQVDPKAALEVLGKLIPGAKLVLDPKTHRLNAYAKPGEQKAIEGVLAKMAAGTTPEDTPQLRTYRLKAANPKTAEQLLKNLVPDARLSVDEKTRSVIALAVPVDQQTIEAALAEIDGKSSAGDHPRLEAYRMRREVSSRMIRSLQYLARDAEISVDSRRNEILVWARPDDHEVIAAAVERFGGGSSEENTPRVEVYQLSRSDPKSTMDLLEDLVPHAQFTLDARRRSLIVLAVPADQEAIKRTLDKLQPEALEGSGAELRFYTLLQDPPPSLLDVLEELVPEAQVSLDDESKRLVVVATPAEHAVVKATVDEVEANIPLAQPKTLVIYNVTPAQRKRFEATLSLIKEELPEVQVIGDAEPGELAIWAKPTEHLMLAGIMEQLKQETPDDEKPKLVPYPVASADPDSVLAMLTKLFPETQFVLDKKTNRLLVSTHASEHESIKASLEAIEAGGPGSQQRRFETYPLRASLSSGILRTLGEMTPNMTVSFDSETNELIAWGTPAEHEIVEAAVGKLGDGKSPENTPELRYYPLVQEPPPSLITVLEELAPDAQVTLDKENKHLAVVATPADHEIVAATIDEVEKNTPIHQPKRVVVYQVTSAEKKRFESAIAAMKEELPDVQVVQGGEPGDLTIWAKPIDHIAIADLMNQLKRELPGSQQRRLLAYSLTAADPDSVMTMVQRLFPDVEFVLDGKTHRVMAWAPLDQHEAIRAALEEMDTGVPAGLEEVFMAHPVPDSDLDAVIEILEERVPDVRFLTDTKGEKILAWGRKSDQDLIEEMLKQLRALPSGEDKPKLVVYPLEWITAEAAKEVLETVVPSAQLTANDELQQLTAWATPEEQEVIASAVQQMDAEGAGGGGKAVAGIYTVESDDWRATYYIGRFLRGVVPDAEFTTGMEDNQLVVWATPKEHEIVKGLIEQMSTEESPETAPRVKVYPLEWISADNAMDIVRLAVPDARLTAGDDQAQLIAWARPKEHELIAGTLEQMDLEGVGGGEERAAIYTVDSRSSRTTYYIGRFLEDVVPKASFSPGMEPGQMVVWATPSDHEKVKALIDQMSAVDPDAPPYEVVVYPLQWTTASVAEEVLAKVVPQVEFVSGEDNEQLIVWARPKDHETIKKTLLSVDVEGAGAKNATAAIYTVDSTSSRSTYYMSMFLQRAVPEASIGSGMEPGQLVVWATPKDHEAVKKLLEQLKAEESPETAPRVVVYTVEGMDADDAIDFLENTLPQAEFSEGTDPSQIIAWARPKDHEIISAAVEQMSAGSAGDKAAKAVVYNLESGNYRTSYYIYRFLREAVPGARFTTGIEDSQIVAWGTPKDHEMIKSLIEQMSAAAPAETAARVVVYDLGSATADTVMDILDEAVPEAELTEGDDPQKLVAWARPKDHEVIDRVIKQMSTTDPAAPVSETVVYPLTWTRASVAEEILAKVVPQAEFVAGEDQERLIVWARPQDHEVIKRTLGAVDVEDPDKRGAVVVVHTIESSDERRAYYMMRFLRDRVSEADFTLGIDETQLVVWATPEEHEKIRSLIEQMSVTEPEERAPRVVVYDLGAASADTVMDILDEAVPGAELTEGDNPQKLVAWARPRDHEVIQRVVEQMSTIDPDAPVSEVVVYPLGWTTARVAEEVLARVVPQAEFTTGEDEQQLIVWARPEEQQVVKRTLEAIDVEAPTELNSTVVIYTLDTSDYRRAYYVMRFLRDLVPRAEYTTGMEDNQLVVWASAADHKEIKSLIEQMSAEEPAETASRVVVYDLGSARAEVAMDILREAVPEARLTEGDDPQKLVAWARPRDHEVIRRVIEQISTVDPAAPVSEVVVYPLEWTMAYVVEDILRKVVPQAEFVAGEEQRQLIVWARPEDHEIIKKTLASVDVEAAGEKDATAVIYTIESSNSRSSYYTSYFLQRAVPEASIGPGIEPSQLIAWATPKDHEKIKELVDQLSASESPETAPRVEVYTIEGIDARNAIRFLEEAVPEAEFGEGSDPTQLLAWARPKEHEIIAAAVEQMSAEIPPDKAAKVVVYTLESGDSRNTYYVYRFLREAVPGATVALGIDPTQLVAWATPKDHEQIASLIDQFSGDLPPERAPRVEVYMVETIDARYAMRILEEAAPGAEFATGSEPGQLMAWATPKEHETIAAAVEQMSAEVPSDKAATAVVYTLESSGLLDAMRIFRTVVPQAQVTVGAEPHQLIAWARPADHRVIEEIVAKLAEKGPTELASKVEVYTLEGTSAAAAIQFLKSTVPQAEFSVGSDPRRLIAWARPADHEVIARAVEQLSQKEDPLTAPSVVVYDLETTGAGAAVRVLQAVVPDARLGVGVDPDKLIAWARPDDHKLIKATVEQLEADSWLAGSRIMAVYPIKSGDAYSLLQILDPVLREHAQFVVDPKRNSLVVWAEKKYHEAVDTAIQQFIEGLEGTREMTSAIYRFQRADPYSAFTVLRSLVPAAQIALDYQNRSLVVSALPEDHEKLRATIEEIDREDPDGPASQLRMHRVTSADPSNVLSILQSLFRANPWVRLSLDRNNDTLIAYASPLEQEKIEELIAEVEKGMLLDSGTTLQLYSMREIDSAAAMQVLNDLLAKRGGRTDMSYEPRSNQLAVLGRPDQHMLIGGVLDQLRGDETILKIYQLENLDSYTAQIGISRLYSYDDPEQPEVDSDSMTQQLFIRASEEQHEKVRKLLIEMGEVQLAIPAGRARTTRVIQFEGNVEDLLEQIEQVWPNLRKNDVQVMTPEEFEATRPESAEDSSEQAAPADGGEDAEEEAGAKQEEPADDSAKPTAAKPEAGARWEITADVQVGEWVEAAATEEEDPPADSAAEPKLPSPVIVVPDGGTITVYCDDPEALDQFEALLQTLAQPEGTVDRNLSIFQLEHTSATLVAEKIDGVLRNSPFGWRGGFGYASIVPDERLNQLIVQGSRLDREKIERLVKIFDSNQMPASLAANKPKIIPIKNTDAAQIERIIRGVFRTQLTASARPSGSSSRRSTGVPLNLTPEMTVDEVTNSLIVKAPSPLIDEIAQLADTLDTAAGEQRARGLRIIQLKKTSAARVGQMLDAIIRTGARSRSR